MSEVRAGEKVADDGIYKQLRAIMRFDKRKDGARGLALTTDFRPLDLRKGDRLEPTASFPDVSAFFSVTMFPVVLLFWRVSRETLARHRNPLFNRLVGVTPKRCLTVDLLHALYLGVIKTYASHLLWQFVLSGCFGPSPGTSEERIDTARLALLHRLINWYKDRHALYPTEYLTRVSDLTRKMMGELDGKRLKVKGAESWGFCCSLWMWETQLHDT